jgi:hypothetical protein
MIRLKKINTTKIKLKWTKPQKSKSTSMINILVLLTKLWMVIDFETKFEIQLNPKLNLYLANRPAATGATFEKLNV